MFNGINTKIIPYKYDKKNLSVKRKSIFLRTEWYNSVQIWPKKIVRKNKICIFTGYIVFLRG